MLERERWLGDRAYGEAEQHQRVVVPGRAVEPEDTAPGAAMDQDPFALATDGDRDRLHRRRAVRVPVTGDVVVEMARPQTGRTVIAVGRAGGVVRHVEPAVNAAEGTGPFP